MESPKAVTEFKLWTAVYTNVLLQQNHCTKWWCELGLESWARILVQVTINRRPLIGRDGHLDQSEAYALSYLVREYGPCIAVQTQKAVSAYFTLQVSSYCILALQSNIPVCAMSIFTKNTRMQRTKWHLEAFFLIEWNILICRILFI